MLQKFIAVSGMESGLKIYILNLHGNSMKKETAPDGSKDENVFDIMVGVSIIIGIKTTLNNNFGELYYSDIYGARETKFNILEKNNIEFIPVKIDTKTYKSKDGVEYTTEGILKIPKIGIEYPILSATSPELLFVSINKYHPKDLKPNEIGNYCIVGHYYENGKMFGKLHKLKNGDKAKLTDLSGNTVTYQVYDKKVIEPTDVSCTSQMVARDMQIRELTLITCTNGGKQRLVVKLREV